MRRYASKLSRILLALAILLSSAFPIINYMPVMAAPSVVAAVTINSAVGSPYQRHTVYSNGRHWVFYSDSVNLVWRSSPDGAAWSGATVIRANTSGAFSSFFFDGTHIHYAAVDLVNFNNNLFYRRGTLNADGTITWSAAEQLVVNCAAGELVQSPSIAVDTTNNPWIAYHFFNGANYDCKIIEDANNDGTWATASTDTIVADDTYNPYVVPMAGGKMMAIWGRDHALPTDIRYKVYNGAAWGAAASVENDVTMLQTTAVSDGDDVHLLYWDINNTEIRHRVYTLGAWGAANIVSTKSDRWPNLTHLGGGDLVAIYATEEEDWVYYRRYIGAAWDGEVNWIDETVDGITTEVYKCSSFAEVGNVTGFVYLSKVGSPYDVNYAFLLGAVAPTITTVAASSVTADTARLNAFLNDDGGEPCEVRFGWGTTSHSCNITAYDHQSAYEGAYTTGQSPFWDITGLTCNMTYYFCSEAQSSVGTDTGGELSFVTANCTIGEPTYFVGDPTEDTIDLTWVIGENASGTEIRYIEGCGDACPTANTTGLALYDGILTYTTATGLTEGTTYCFKAWGYAGSTWSTANITLCVTTLGVGAPGDPIPAPVQPTGWFAAPDHTGLVNFMMYDPFNAMADYMGMPRPNFWLAIAVVASVLIALVFGGITKSIVWATLALGLGMAIGWAVDLIPFWMLGMSILFIIAAAAVKRREVG